MLRAVFRHPLERLRQAFYRWALRGRPPEPMPIILSQRRVYVLPTRAGLAYVVTLFVILLGAINYNLSLGHALAFLMVGLGITAILHTFRNLAHLRITGGRCPPVFAGQHAHFGLVLHNPRRFPRFNVQLRAESGPAVFADIPAEDSLEIGVPTPTHQRGWAPIPRITLSTAYPLGLIRTWAYAAPDLRCLVYPAPAKDAPPLPEGGGHQQGRLRQGRGDDDFAGLRRHLPGEPLQHVAWKSAARQPDAELLAKHFTGTASETLWLDWHTLPANLDTETRLAILARWIVDTQATGLTWGLRLPSRELEPASGEAHYHRCLTALATYGT